MNVYPVTAVVTYLRELVESDFMLWQRPLVLSSPPRLRSGRRIEALAERPRRSFAPLRMTAQ